MDVALKILFIAQALSFAELRSSAFEGPEDTIAYVGDNVTMRCALGTGGCTEISQITKSRRHGDPLSPAHEYIFRNNQQKIADTRYSVDNNASGCHVVIRNVHYNDSGKYNCEAVLPNHTTAWKSGSLIILESSPKCAVNLPPGSNEHVMEGEEVKFTCESTYDGAQGNMTWKGAEKGRSEEDKTGNTYTLSYSVAAEAQGISSLVCEVQFTPQNTATDLSSLRVSCQTQAIEVLYSARNVRLTPLSSAYSPGSVVTCHADGNPAPVIRWQSLNTTQNVSSWRDVPDANNGSELVVGSDVSVRYRCVASNVVRNSSHFDISCHVGVGETDEHGYSTAVAIAVGFITGFLAAVLLLFVVWIVHRRFFSHQSATIQKQ